MLTTKQIEDKRREIRRHLHNIADGETVAEIEWAEHLKRLLKAYDIEYGKARKREVVKDDKLQSGDGTMGVKSTAQKEQGFTDYNGIYGYRD